MIRNSLSFNKELWLPGAAAVLWGGDRTHNSALFWPKGAPGRESGHQGQVASLQLTLEQRRVWGANPCAVGNLPVYNLTPPKFNYTVVSRCPQENGPGTPADTKIRGRSSPLYKMA